MYLEASFLVVIFALVVHQARKFQRQRNSDSFTQSKLKIVPTVFSWIPLIGHLISMTSDPKGFLFSCYKRYGEIFTIKLGPTKMTVLCNRELINKYFSSAEKQLSFYKYVDNAGISRAFSDELYNAAEHMKLLIKKVFVSHMSEFLEVVNDEMDATIEELKQNVLKDKNSFAVNIKDIMRRTYVRAIFKAMFAFPMTPDISQSYDSFYYWMILTAFASNILPARFVEFTFHRITVYFRKRYVEAMLPFVQTYIDNVSMQESRLIRATIDTPRETAKGPQKLSAQEVCEILLTTHFQVLSSPLSSASQILKELTSRSDLWRQLREELGGASIDETLRNKLLHACVIEGMRLNGNGIVSVRSPHANSVVGPYYVGDVDVVAVPGALLFEMEPGNDIFEHAQYYNPERFMRDDNPEKMDPKLLWLWGAGVHACPGRNVSTNILKILVKQFVTKFDAEVADISERNHLWFGSVAEQRMKFKLFPVRSLT